MSPETEQRLKALREDLPDVAALFDELFEHLAAIQALRAASIAKLELQPGDTLVLEFDRTLSEFEAKCAFEMLEALAPLNVRTLISDNGAKLRVMHPTPPAAEGGNSAAS